MKLRRVLFFALPWLIILLVPQLRLPARVALGGSEYVEDGNVYYLRPHVLLPFGWLSLSPPTLTELWRKAGNDPQAQIAILLKAPQNHDDSAIPFNEARQRYAKALQIAPHDAALLAASLRLVADTSGERVVPPFSKENSEPFNSAWFGQNAAPSELPTACLTVRSDDAIYQDEFEPMALPFAFPPLAYLPEPVASPVSEPQNSSLSPAGWPAGSMVSPSTTSSSSSSCSQVPSPLLGLPSGVPVYSKRLMHGPPSFETATRRHALAAIEWAQRGGAMEPDNAWWDWALVGFNYAARRDEEALRALHRASLKPHFDAHEDFERRAALRAATLHRPLLAEEKVSVWDRQFTTGSDGFQRARLVMWSLLSAKRCGEIGQALTIARDAACLGALIQREARTRTQLRAGLRLQSAAWTAIGGPVRGKKPTGVRSPIRYWYSVPIERSLRAPNPRAAPLDFAQQFASVARRAGRADFAAEALQQAREAGPRQLLLMRPETDWYQYVTPDVLAPLRLLKSAAWMVLAQGRLVLLAGVAACFLLWPPLWKLGHPATRWWRRLIVTWRGETIHPTPPADAPREITRDVRAALWTGAVVTSLCGAITLLCAPDTDLPSVLWPLREQPLFYIERGYNYALTCLASPLIGAALWSIFPPLRRLLRVRREALAPRDVNSPPSLRPLLWALVAWGAVFYAALSWLLSALSQADSFHLTPFMEDHAKLLLTLLNFIDRSYWILDIDQWISDYGSAAWLTGGALALWLLKWHRELPPAWRWRALHATLLRFRRTTLAWLPITGWLFLIFLLAALPYRRSADTQFERRLSQPDFVLESAPDGD